MHLSKRLMTAAGMIQEGKCLADAGTDHGYVPIYLVQAGRIDRAVALDINSGPLERAKEHIRQQGLEDRIETRLSDGLEALKPREADCMLAAGMGGSLIIHILREGKEAAALMKECILQPQSEIDKLRKYLWEQGYGIESEDMVYEDGKYYPMMRAVPGGYQEIDPHFREVYARYGPCLLEQRHPVLKQFLEREERLQAQLEEQLQRQERPPEARLKELDAQRELIRQAWTFW